VEEEAQVALWLGWLWGWPSSSVVMMGRRRRGRRLIGAWPVMEAVTHVDSGARVELRRQRAKRAER
jgi:hypothetical protein